MPPTNSYTSALTPEQQKLLRQVLDGGNYTPVAVEHTLFAAATPDCRIAMYKSGKCVVQGKGATDFVTFVLEPLVLQAVRVGYEDVLDPEATRAHLGVDESGKGDFFGPLVTACAYTDESLVPAMRDMGVRDSKKITSDAVAIRLAADLRRLLGDRYAVVAIGPAAYNRLYAKMRSVNSILAWAHARSIENALEKVPHCPRAISDQFGSKEQVARALMKRGRKIELVQRHRAESDLAVAAASILARAGFLHALRDMHERWGIVFPKGASSQVQAAGQEFVRRHGGPALLQAAKCHFRTTDAVLGPLGIRRSDLGPEGMIVSKTFNRDAKSPSA